MRIYAVIEDWCCDYEQQVYVMAMFDNAEDALRYMEQEWDKIIQEGMYPASCNCFDETGTWSREAYEDGDATSNHHKLFINWCELNAE